MHYQIYWDEDSDENRVPTAYEWTMAGILPGADPVEIAVDHLDDLVFLPRLTVGFPGDVTRCVFENGDDPRRPRTMAWLRPIYGYRLALTDFASAIGWDAGEIEHVGDLKMFSHDIDSCVDLYESQREAAHAAQACLDDLHDDDDDGSYANLLVDDEGQRYSADEIFRVVDLDGRAPMIPGLVRVRDGQTSWYARLSQLLSYLDAAGWRYDRPYPRTRHYAEPVLEDADEADAPYAVLCCSIPQIYDATRDELDPADDPTPEFHFRPDLGPGTWELDRLPEPTATEEPK